MQRKQLEWKNVPKDWAVCFNLGCALHETCLRWQAGLLIPEGLTIARCVTPRALTEDQCRHFASTEPVKYARGFSTIYDRVLKDDYTPLRKEMTAMLQGKRYYYEYKRGDRRLSPRQQESIRRLFAKYGYEDHVRFDDFEYDFVFPWP